MATMPICEKICDFFSLNQSPQTLVDTKRKYFSGLFEKGYKLHLIKGVLELIKHYYENGITLVLASSASTLTSKTALIEKASGRNCGCSTNEASHRRSIPSC